MVPIKQSQERPLSPSRPLNTPEPQIVPRPLQIPQIPEQLLDPKRRALAHSRELGRLEMGETQSGEVPVLLGECVETGDDDC